MQSDFFRLTPKLTGAMSENKTQNKPDDSSSNGVGFSELLAGGDTFTKLPIILKLTDESLLEIEDGKIAKAQVEELKQEALKRGLKWMTSYDEESQEHILQISR